MELSVNIVGPRKLQNELMAWYIEKEIGLRCMYCQQIGLTPIKKCQKSIILFDSLHNDLDKLWTILDIGTNSSHAERLVVLFNVSSGLGIEKEAVNRGARGIFFENDDLSIFIKGIRAILNGELWFSRNILTDFILDTVSCAGCPQKTQPVPLTPRETEILTIMATGATNEEIAEKLCISIHTVKTHIYNIYQKINVPNRFQASLWCSQNL